MTKTDIQLDILTIAPHPDDAEMCVGGFLTKMSGLGYKTGVIDLTEGEMGTLGTVETRKLEAERAGAVMGLAYRANAKFPDGSIGVASDSANLSLDDQLRSAISYLRTLRPTLLLIPYWEERHPDHVGTSRLFERAVLLAGLKNFSPNLGAPFVPKQTVYYQMRYEFKPTFIVDVTAEYPKKLAAINCFASQVAPEEKPATNVLVGTSLHLSALEARDRHLGSMIGADFGEAFLTRNTLGISNPMAFFCENSKAAPLYFPPIG